MNTVWGRKSMNAKYLLKSKMANFRAFSEYRKCPLIDCLSLQNALQSSIGNILVFANSFVISLFTATFAVITTVEGTKLRHLRKLKN